MIKPNVCKALKYNKLTRQTSQNNNVDATIKAENAWTRNTPLPFPTLSLKKNSLFS